MAEHGFLVEPQPHGMAKSLVGVGGACPGSSRSALVWAPSSAGMRAARLGDVVDDHDFAGAGGVAPEGVAGRGLRRTSQARQAGSCRVVGVIGEMAE